MEAERNKPVNKLKVSTRKQYLGVSDVQLSSPRPSACGLHQVCQLSAHVNINGTCYGTLVEDVYYELPPAEGESDKETKMRADRHRHREEVALKWLSYGVTRPTSGHMLWKPRGPWRVATTGTCMACTLQKGG